MIIGLSNRPDRAPKISSLGASLRTSPYLYRGYPSDLSACLLSSIVEAMIEKATTTDQEFGGVHAAFLARVNRYAVATAAIMELGQ